MFDNNSIKKLRGWITENYTPDDETFAYRLATILKEEREKSVASKNWRGFFGGLSQTLLSAAAIGALIAVVVMFMAWATSDSRSDRRVAVGVEQYKKAQEVYIDQLKVENEQCATNKVKVADIYKKCSDQSTKEQKELEATFAAEIGRIKSENANMKKMVSDIAKSCAPTN